MIAAMRGAPAPSRNGTSPAIVASGSGCRPTNPRYESTPFYGADS